jgi:hypothetical protein
MRYLAAMLLACIFLTLAVLADFKLTFGDKLHIRCENGRLTFSDALENGVNIDDWGDLSKSSLQVLKDIGKSAWGFGFRYVSFAGSGTVWYMYLPLAIFLVIFTIFFGLFVNLVRKAKRKFHITRLNGRVQTCHIEEGLTDVR